MEGRAGHGRKTKPKCKEESRTQRDKRREGVCAVDQCMIP